MPAHLRAVLPRSIAGRLWAIATVVVGPALFLAATEAPVRLFADRLPTISIDRWGILRTPIVDDHSAAVRLLIYTGAVWLTFLVVRFVPAERVSRTGLWAGLVPLLYLLAGSAVGLQIARVMENLDAERINLIRGVGPTATRYAVMFVSLAVGAVMARQVLRHLPRPTPDRVRAAWVGSVPLGPPVVVAYASIAAVCLFLSGWVQTVELMNGVLLAVVVLALWHWTIGNADVTVTRSGIQVTGGAFRPLRNTKTLPLAEIRDVEIVQASSAQAVRAALWLRYARWVFRRGPALRVHRTDPSKGPWLLGMESAEEAEQAAAAIRNWRRPPTTV